ncbi:ATP-binding protein [Enterococcus avium]|uniref:ATP-binding protein n=1 Tax=Enterococcus avium TaxID=33945 RepID=UPI00288CA69D|nr:ATP-binding protein [Enterococcus avium]MBN2918985.1 ATP-binding protein [Lactobacillus sp.]MDT2477439.1 ATP-binding protein [Enterococcus avium]
MEPSKKLGVIVAVDGVMSQVGMYSMSNDADFIWYGDVLTGPKIGAFLTINQNSVKIIATVSTEKIIDQQNTIRSVEFDNRYSKGSINRIITLNTKGVIEKGKFQVTSKYVSMIGNEVTLTTKEELKIIYGIENNVPSIYIGKSILEGHPINISIDRFFASHIGIFGNTGSGKSNTLHKIYLQLLDSSYREMIFKKSQFYLIDFNGEYTGPNHFGVSEENGKKIFKINTRDASKSDKLPVKKEYLFDADILSILFDARPATQVPFLRNAIKFYNKQQFDGEKFAKLVVGIYKRILTTSSTARAGSKKDWEDLAKKYVKNDQLFEVLNSLEYYPGKHSYKISKDYWINENTEITVDKQILLRLVKGSEDGLTELLTYKFNSCSEIKKLEMFLDFQKIFETTWNKFNIEHINPLFSRIENSLSSLEKVVDIKEDILTDYGTFNIISLIRANQEITRLVPMLISKMIYDIQKNAVAGGKVVQTKHLIIDEAHNILNGDIRGSGDTWQDYRLSVFEEIIKEGRKFGFYLTLSSQRPSDISPTILSQTHNYFIHRLVNEKDLKILENTMPTLDRNSFRMIPNLGQGEVIITGNAMKVPVFVKIKKEEINRPYSDDVVLTNLWSKEKIENFDVDK